MQHISCTLQLFTYHQLWLAFRRLSVFHENKRLHVYSSFCTRLHWNVCHTQLVSVFVNSPVELNLWHNYILGRKSVHMHSQLLLPKPVPLDHLRKQKTVIPDQFWRSKMAPPGQVLTTEVYNRLEGLMTLCLLSRSFYANKVLHVECEFRRVLSIIRFFT